MEIEEQKDYLQSLKQQEQTQRMIDIYQLYNKDEKSQTIDSNQEGGSSEQEEPQKDLTKITFLSELMIVQSTNSIGIAEQDVYVVEFKDEEGKTKYDLYTYVYNDKTKAEERVLIAEVDENGIIKFTQDYLDILKNIDKRLYDMAEKANKDGKNQLKLPEVLELEDISKTAEELERMAQEQRKDVDNPDEDEEDQDVAEQEQDDQSLTTIATQAGISKRDIASSTKINPREPIAEGITFESAIGKIGKYASVHAIYTGSSYEIWGIDHDGNAEQVIKKSGKTSGERSVSLMNENGTSITKQQARAIFNIDSTQALAINIESAGKMNVYYLARGDQQNEYFGIPIASDRQSRSTGKVEHFMGVEMANRQNRIEAVDKAYEQLDEVKETNQTLIDQDESNDVIYYDVDEEITMHDGSKTTLYKEASNSQLYEGDINQYIKDLQKMNGDCLSDKISSMREYEIEELAKREKEQEQREKIKDMGRAVVGGIIAGGIMMNRDELVREERLTPEEEALRRAAMKTPPSNS